ncbi:hypothetical protein J3B01_004933 [Coemansia erecta]|nr:hypothetical protein J3B01_004933 [Coemansia erecta]
MLNSKGKYVFSRSMLAVWAGGYILVGISSTLVAVSQGWLRFANDADEKPAVEDGSNDTESSEMTDAEMHKLLEDQVDVIDAKLPRMTDAELLQSIAARECLDNPDEWKRVPFFWPRSDIKRKSAFVPGTMYAENKLSVEPVVFMNRDRKQFVVITHIGKEMCGHDDIVHGGVQATLFDEITARPAFWNLPRNVALTASLKIAYHKPAIADQIFVFRTHLAKMEGRKAEIAAQLEDSQGNLLSEAEALYISPKNVTLVQDQTSQVEKIENVYPGNF